jgi:hypothetical protein
MPIEKGLSLARICGIQSGLNNKTNARLKHLVCFNNFYLLYYLFGKKLFLDC